jgi:MGT family glycosyltransferase
VAKVLFTVWPFAGHVHPAIAIGHALRSRGHEVAFYTGDAVRSLVEAEGFRCYPFAHVNEKRVIALASSEFPYRASIWQQLRHAKQLQARFREWLLDTVPQQVEDLEEILTEWRPDVLVCDLAFWSPILVLGETRQIPVAVLSILAACILPGPDAPAWGQGAPRPRNRMMRLRSTMQRKLLQWLSAGFLSHANGIRRRYGLPALRCSVTEFAGQMPLYIVPSMREYDYDRRDLPLSVQYVGPCLWDKSAAAPPPEWLLHLSGDRPLIYVTEATIGTDEPFLLQAAVRAFRDLPVQVVMTTGAQRDAATLDFGAPAPNVRVESYVPQSDLLPRTAVMVTLGGSGGVLAALKAGVPLVVVPTEWDRPENAQRVVEAGAGLRIPPGRCTPERLRAAVERILREPSFRMNAQRLAAVCAGYRGPDRASELLEGLCATPYCHAGELLR